MVLARVLLRALGAKALYECYIADSLTRVVSSVFVCLFFCLIAVAPPPPPPPPSLCVSGSGSMSLSVCLSVSSSFFLFSFFNFSSSFYSTLFRLTWRGVLKKLSSRLHQRMLRCLSWASTTRSTPKTRWWSAMLPVPPTAWLLWPRSSIRSSVLRKAWWPLSTPPLRHRKLWMGPQARWGQVQEIMQTLYEC